MKVEIAVLEAVELLKKNSIASPFLDARIMLAKIIGCDYQDIIFKYSNLDLSNEQYQQYQNLINQRINKVPVAYLTNQREFFGNNFYVDNRVLDPRPDSETLIEMVIDKNRNLNSSYRICDIGSGSGCLIISLLKIYKNWRGSALDLSSRALEVCKINAIHNKVASQIEFIESDVFLALTNHLNLFDIIISNPPYIPSNDIKNLQDEVRLYEPRMALDGGLDGLDFYRKIAKNCNKYLNEGGQIFVEIGCNQHDEVIKIFQNVNLKFIDYKKDLNQIIRVLEFNK